MHLSRPLWLMLVQPGVEHSPRAAFFSAIAILRAAVASGRRSERDDRRGRLRWNMTTVHLPATAADNGRSSRCSTSGVTGAGSQAERNFVPSDFHDRPPDGSDPPHRRPTPRPTTSPSVERVDLVFIVVRARAEVRGHARRGRFHNPPPCLVVLPLVFEVGIVPKRR